MRPSPITTTTMRRSLPLVVLVLATLGLPGLACGPAATPVATPTAVPSPAPSPTGTPSEVAEWRDTPACDGLEKLPQAILFDWEGKEEVGDAGTWEYYRCQQPQAQVAAFYREMSLKPPYNWQEMAWVEKPQGTLGIYFHAAFQVWLYRWVLPDPAGEQTSRVVVARRDGLDNLKLPCCD